MLELLQTALQTKMSIASAIILSTLSLSGGFLLGLLTGMRK
jgi:hypothetical protein